MRTRKKELKTYVFVQPVAESDKIRSSEALPAYQVYILCKEMNEVHLPHSQNQRCVHRCLDVWILAFVRVQQLCMGLQIKL